MVSEIQGKNILRLQGTLSTPIILMNSQSIHLLDSMHTVTSIQVNINETLKSNRVAWLLNNIHSPVDNLSDLVEQQNVLGLHQNHPLCPVTVLPDS